MLKALKIEGLRGIRSADLQEALAPLSIFVGPNGSAKSTVLEAAGVACAGHNGPAVMAALTSREWLGIGGMDYILPLGKGLVSGSFFDSLRGNRQFDSRLELGPTDGTVTTSRPGLAAELKTTLDVSGNQIWIDDDGNSISSIAGQIQEKFELIHISVDRPAGAAERFRKPRFSSALRSALGQLKLSPLYADVFANIKELRPTLESIESIPVGDRDEPFMFENTPRGRIGYPIAYAGDGFRRTLLLAAGVAAAGDGVVAIDEPDAFAHPTMFDRLASLIRRAVEGGTQVMYATHSMEFVGATLRAFHDKLDALAVFGLQLVDGRLDYVRIPGADAERRVHKLGHDLRL